MFSKRSFNSSPFNSPSETATTHNAVASLSSSGFIFTGLVHNAAASLSCTSGRTFTGIRVRFASASLSSTSVRSFSSNVTYRAIGSITNKSTLAPKAITAHRAVSLMNVRVAAMAPGLVAGKIVFTSDTTTQGSWVNMYGTEGYYYPENDSTSVYSALPSYLSGAPVLAGNSTFTWTTTTTDVRALQDPTGTFRYASCWYNGTPWTITINVNDERRHSLAIYTIDWDGTNTRSMRIDVADVATGIALDSRIISNYSNGIWQVYSFKNSVIFTFTNLADLNAAVSGLFFDPNIRASAVLAANDVEVLAGVVRHSANAAISCQASVAANGKTTSGATTSLKSVATLAPPAKVQHVASGVVINVSNSFDTSAVTHRATASLGCVCTMTATGRKIAFQGYCWPFIGATYPPIFG